jgi:hypothetical protein
MPNGSFGSELFAPSVGMACFQSAQSSAPENEETPLIDKKNSSDRGATARGFNARIHKADPID